MDRALKPKVSCIIDLSSTINQLFYFSLMFRWSHRPLCYHYITLFSCKAGLHQSVSTIVVERCIEVGWLQPLSPPWCIHKSHQVGQKATKSQLEVFYRGPSVLSDLTRFLQTTFGLSMCAAASFS